MTIPVLDVSPLPVRPFPATAGSQERAVAEQIDRACRDTGFFVVVGHGVDPALRSALDRSARAFFALPTETKAAIAMDGGGRAWRGWFPEGGELTAGRPDRKEGLYFGTELAADDPRVVAGTPLHGPNRFPAEPADLRAAVLGWMAAVTDLGHRLIRAVGIGLGLAPDWFDRHLTADPTILFRIFRYPPLPADEEGWGVGEHTDYGLLTLLATDGRPGLEVHGPDGWLAVPAVDDSFVVNLGDMLEAMTGGAYRSTPHRVRHEPTTDGGDRLSFPCFFDPGWDAPIRPVDSLASTATAPSRQRWDGATVDDWSGTYGDYLTAKVARVFPDLAGHLDPSTAGSEGT